MPHDAQHTTLQFLGAADTVTGSKYLLSIGERRILIDFGMFQGNKKYRERNWAEFPFDPATISDVLITHAHMDHVGLLPKLVAEGYRGPIFATEATRQLAEIVLRDGAKIQEQDAREANEGGYSKHSPALPLYTTADVEATMPLFVPIPFDEPIDLDDGVIAQWTRSAHILGSASITLWTDTGAVVFSGDVGRHTHPVLRPREVPEGAPFALIESTYGDREHPDLGDTPHEAFADAIRRTVERGGSILVPAFAVDRTEIVLKTLSELRRAGRIPALPVYVDSPMANLALDVYRSMPGELNPSLHLEDIIGFPDLHSIRDAADSKQLVEQGPGRSAIIVASSGMATGGRVVHHLEKMLPDARNTIVLTGYQAEGTRGRQLVDGAEKLKMRGKYIPVRADVVQDSEFSVHGDRSDLLDWLRDLDPRPHTVFCVHGEAERAAAFAASIEREFPGIDAIVPGHGEVVVLDALAADATPRPQGATSVDRTLATAAPAPRSAATPATSMVPAPPASVSGAPRAAVAGYRLATGVTPDELAAAVTTALHEGYELHGAPSLGAVEGHAVYLQALVTREG